MAFVMTTLSNPLEPLDGIRSRPTMRDVAALAGVSLKTVSRVVNRETGVSGDLVARVERAAGQLDYRHDLTASNLRRADRKTGTVGLLIEDVSNPFFSAVLRGIEEVARERHVAVFAASGDDSPERERELVVAFTRRRVDAIIMTPTIRDQSYLVHEQRGGLAIVFVDREPRGIEADCVVTNNIEGAMAATRQLIEIGHTRIAFLGDDPAITTSRLRATGFLQAFAAAGIPAAPELIVQDSGVPDFATERVVELMRLDDPPTAIFAAQNFITMGAVRALHRLDLHRRVALIGFDDFPMADTLDPAITVVAQDPREIGRRAAHLAFERIENPELPTGTYVVPSVIVRRGSGEIPPGR
jgi:LacI family transcriptional regulator